MEFLLEFDVFVNDGVLFLGKCYWKCISMQKLPGRSSDAAVYLAGPTRPYTETREQVTPKEK